jgi:heptosyltransferase-3
MDQVLQRLPPAARIAVIRLRSLGDCVLTTPALALLKQTRPDLQLAVVVEEQFAPVFSGNTDVDRIFPPSAAALWRWRPDLTLNLHGGTRSLQLTIAARSPIRAGFGHFRLQAAYNVRIPRAQEILGLTRKVHTAEHLASAMFYLGVPTQDIPRANLVASTPAGPGPYAVLHPMASTPEKTWPAGNFLELARHIQREQGLEPVFIGGPDESLIKFRDYRCVSGASLEKIKSLLAGASLFAGNDSGPAHMAAAFGLPVLVIFGPSDTDVWRPWKTKSAVLADREGIAHIAVSDAIAAIEKLPVLFAASSRLPQ